MNVVVIAGRLTQTPLLRQTASGKAVSSFTVAVNRRDGADFINCVVFGGQAESLTLYKKKGDQIGVIGRLSTRSYEKEGRQVYITEVIANEIKYFGKSEANEFRDLGTDIPEEDLPF